MGPSMWLPLHAPLTGGSQERGDDFSVVITFSEMQLPHSSVLQTKWQTSKSLLSPAPLLSLPSSYKLMV